MVSRLNGVWRVLQTRDTDPYRNMSLEESLLLAVEARFSPNTLRFWKNQRSAILGISQKPEEEVNLENCSKHHVCVVKRFTGGGAVYNDLGNLNWTIVFQKELLNNLNVLGIHELYEVLCSPVISAVRDFGLGAEFRPPTSIFLMNKKISGLSMRIYKNTILCHGTLLMDADITILNSILKKLKDPVTNINDHAKVKITDEDIMRKIIEHARNIFKIRLEFGDISTNEKKIQETLPLNKYRI